MIFDSSDPLVYLAIGSVDMRKSINGLSILVEEHFELNPLSGHFFVFCNRRRNLIKILYWDRNGFCLWQKRLEKHFFRWPEQEAEIMQIDRRQLIWLLEGLDIGQVHGHVPLKYSSLW